MSRASRQNRGPIDRSEAIRRLDIAALATAETLAPSPEKSRAILDERARALARVPADALDAGRRLEVVLFELGGERMALESRYVRHVLRPSPCAPLPGGSVHLDGLMNLRGEILAVFDLARLLGAARPAGGDEARVLVLGDSTDEFGVWADAVREVTTMDVDALSEPPGPSRHLARGVTPAGLLVLEGSAMLGDAAFVVDQGESSGLVPEYGGGS